MTDSHARRPTAPKAIALPAADLIGMIAKRSPNTSRTHIEALGRATAAVGAEIAKLTADQQRRLVARTAALRDLVIQALETPDPAASAEDHIILKPRGPVEVSQGEGLGARLTLEDGRRRVRGYALATGTSFDSWAGPTAGPVDLARKLGVSRSTLHAWQTKGLAIGLLNGLRKTVFPLEQFVDGKPVAGIADVLEVIGEPRVAWMWLKEASPRLNGATPLARLKRGHLDEVLRAAQINFGQ
jgi:hypothetical protein